MDTSGPTLLTGRCVTGSGVIEDGALVVDGDRIVFAGRASEVPAPWQGAPHPAGWTAGRTLLPGLIDTHCHGGAGGEFGPDPDSAALAARHHHTSGTTTLLGSLVSASRDTLVSGVGTCAAMVAAG